MSIRLLELREKQGWTQNKLSEVSGVSQQFISAVERGERVPNVYIALKLAKALGVAVEDMVETSANEPGDRDPGGVSGHLRQNR